MRAGEIIVSSTFPVKSGDKFIFRDRHGRVTSIHEVTYVDEKGKKGQIAYTKVRDC